MTKETEQEFNEKERSELEGKDQESVQTADAAELEQVNTEETAEAGETSAHAEAEETAVPQETEDAAAELESLRAELEKEQNKYLRLLADYDNFKRRTQKEREDAEKFRSRSLLTDLLPVLDNFERALSVEAKSEEAQTLLKGVQMVHSTLLEAVKREGLEEVKAVGEQFDPNIHQAVMQEKDDSKESGIVLQELQKGYTLKGRVLRPAMVKVNE